MFYNFSFEDLIKCVEREIAMRKRVYPSRVAAAKMTQGQADREIDMMKCIRKCLIALGFIELLDEIQRNPKSFMSCVEYMNKYKDELQQDMSVSEGKDA